MLELGTRVAIVDDLVVAERFYAEILGAEILGNGSVDTRYMLSTDEFLEAQRRGASRHDTPSAPAMDSSALSTIITSLALM